MPETQARWRTSQTNFEILRGSRSDVDAARSACLSLLAQTTGISYCRTWATEYGLLWPSRRTQRRSRRLSEKLRGHSCSANAVRPAIIFQLTALCSSVQERLRDSRISRPILMLLRTQWWTGSMVVILASAGVVPLSSWCWWKLPHCSKRKVVLKLWRMSRKWLYLYLSMTTSSRIN